MAIQLLNKKVLFFLSLLILLQLTTAGIGLCCIQSSCDKEGTVQEDRPSTCCSHHPESSPEDESDNNDKKQHSQSCRGDCLSTPPAIHIPATVAVRLTCTQGTILEFTNYLCDWTPSIYHPPTHSHTVI